MNSSRLIAGAIASSIAMGSAHAMAVPAPETSPLAAKPAISAAARQQIRDKIARMNPGIHVTGRRHGIGATNFSEAHPHFTESHPAGPAPQPEYTQFSAQAPVPKGQRHHLHHRYHLHHRHGDLNAPATSQRPDVMLAFQERDTDRG